MTQIFPPTLDLYVTPVLVRRALPSGVCSPLVVHRINPAQVLQALCLAVSPVPNQVLIQALLLAMLRLILQVMSPVPLQALCLAVRLVPLQALLPSPLAVAEQDLHFN
jgi:hypothetical protein